MTHSQDTGWMANGAGFLSGLSRYGPVLRPRDGVSTQVEVLCDLDLVQYFTVPTLFFALRRAHLECSLGYAHKLHLLPAADVERQRAA